MVYRILRRIVPKLHSLALTKRIIPHQHHVRRLHDNFNTVKFDGFTSIISTAMHADRLDKVAVIECRDDQPHKKYTYKQLVSASKCLASKISNSLDSKQKSIAFLTPGDHRYVITQWATWLSNNIAVPLHKSQPSASIEYVLNDSQAALVITTPEFKPVIDSLNLSIPVIVIDDTEGTMDGPLPGNEDLQALLKYRGHTGQIIYTSGTTGPPKGVLTTHKSLFGQTVAVGKEWIINCEDTVLHVLPLHHTHGIVNALMVPLFVGGKVQMIDGFNPKKMWNEMLSEHNSVNILMGVPTIYAKLIEYAKQNFNETKYLKDFLKLKLRLTVCGSASLPIPILEAWRELTGHTLLERYGMSEFGMGLGNPLDESLRKPGFVGHPFTGIKVRIVKWNAYNKNKYETLVEGNRHRVKVCNPSDPFGTTGELLVKGPQVFSGYLNKPEATAKAFTKDGWFITGDVAAYKEGAFRIVGRNSVDIIKSGGHKISALDVERELLSHEDIDEVCVFGVPDITWGEQVAAVIKMKKKKNRLSVPELRSWCSGRLASYMTPTLLKIVDEIPRNAMGKVNKVEVRLSQFPEYMTRDT